MRTDVLLLDFLGVVFVFYKLPLITDADVKIKTIDKPFTCGSTVTLTCVAKGDSFTVAWLNENDSTPIAKCTRLSCRLNPDYTEQYSFSPDMQVLNLTIRKVTTRFNSKKLICSDGTNEDFHIIEVKDSKALLYEDGENSWIKATSGCIAIGETISFKWMKINASSKQESEFYPQDRHIHTTDCSDDTKCGKYKHIKLTETITAEPSRNGKYHIKCILINGNDTIESNITVGAYELKELLQDINDDDHQCKDQSDITFWIVFSICSMVIIPLAMVCCFVIYMRRRETERRKYTVK